MNCISARPNRYKIFFCVVDRPANCQHLGSLKKGCDKFFSDPLTTSIRGANSSDVRHFMTLGLHTVNILVTAQEPFRDLRRRAEIRFGGRIERRTFLKGALVASASPASAGQLLAVAGGGAQASYRERSMDPVVGDGDTANSIGRIYACAKRAQFSIASKEEQP
jgi:hypothetical protein